MVTKVSTSDVSADVIMHVDGDIVDLQKHRYPELQIKLTYEDL